MMERIGLNSEVLSGRNLKRVLYIVPSIPREVAIQFTNLCNLDCKMCPKYGFDLKDEHMKIEMFKRIADRLDGVEEIALIGYGEPLLNPSFFEAVEYAKKKGFIITTVSNGYMLLKKKIFQQLVDSDVDVIRFSIETVHEEDVGGHVGSMKVLDAIKSLKKEFLKRGKKTKIIINTVFYKDTKDNIVPIIKWSEGAGLDQVDIAHFNKLGFKVDPGVSSEEEIKFYKKLNKMKFRIRVTSLHDRYVGLRKSGFRFMTKCPMSYDNVHITLSGGISPCICGFPSVEYGNLFSQTLKEVWNGKRFKNFRKHQKEICKNCTLFKLYE